MGPILKGRFREVVALARYNIVVGDNLVPKKVIDIGEWSICGGGRIERFHCVYMHICI